MALIQLVALLTIAIAGAGQPKILLMVYIPLIVVCAVVAALCMENIASVSNAAEDRRDCSTATASTTRTWP